MGVLTTGLYRILNCFTIYFLLSYVEKLFRSRTKCFYLVYGIIVLGLLHTIAQAVLMSVSLTDSRFAYLSGYVSPYFRSATAGMLDNDPLIALGLACLLVHHVNVLHYVLFDLMKFFGPECDELLAFMKCDYDNRVTLLDCLIRRMSIATVKQYLNSMTDLVLLNSNPFLTRTDKKNIMIFYKSLEAFFTGCFLIVLLASSVFQFHTDRKSSLVDRFGLIATQTFHQIQFISGVCCPLLLGMVVYFLAMINMTPWMRYSRHLIRTGSMLARRSEVKALLMLKLNAGKWFFVSWIKPQDKLNRKLFRKVFSRSLMITLIANLLFIAKICIQSTSPLLRTFILASLISQTIIILGSLLSIIYWSELMYSPSKVYLSCHAKIASRRRITNLADLIRLCNFIEVLHNKKPYTCSFASIGKIIRKSLFNFLPVYSSFLMFIFPFFY